MLRYGISSLLLIGALLIGIFYLKPAWDDFQSIRAETNRVRDLSAELDGLIQNRDALIAKLNLISKDDLNKLRALIPAEPQSLDYLIALQQAAQESGIGLAFTKADINPPESSGSASGAKPGTRAAGGTSSASPGQPQMLNPSTTTAQPKATTIKDLPVGIDIAGSYDQLKQFVKRLEHFGRLTDIGSLSFSAPSSGNGGQAQSSGGAFTFSLGIITHYQQP